MRFFYYRAGHTKFDEKMGILKEISEIEREIKLYEGLYNDMLRPLFTEVTGLDTHMPSVIFK